MGLKDIGLEDITRSKGYRFGVLQGLKDKGLEYIIGSKGYRFGVYYKV